MVDEALHQELNDLKKDLSELRTRLQEVKDQKEQRDWAIQASMRAISKFILDLAFTNRAGQIEEN